MGKPDPREIIERHRKRLMQIDGVVGVAFGAPDGKPEGRCILVYATVDDWPPELPRQLEGYPVELQKATGFYAQ